MGVELAVLDRLQRRGQQRRHLGRRDHDPVLAVDREDAADQQRVEAHDGDLLAVRVPEARQHAVRERQPECLRLLKLVGKAELADVHAQVVAPPAEGARAVGLGDGEVAEALELVGEALRRELLARIEVDATARTRVPAASSVAPRTGP